MPTRERVDRKTQPLQWITQFFRSDRKKARFEAVNILHLGDVFEYGDGTKQFAIAVAHRRNAQAIAALRAADAHGQKRRLALACHGALHGYGITHSVENFFSARRISECHSIRGGFAKQLDRKSV